MLPFTIIRTSTLDEWHDRLDDAEQDYSNEHWKRKDLQQQVYELEDRLDNHLPWWWMLTAAVLAMLTGFFWGMAVAL